MDWGNVTGGELASSLQEVETLCLTPWERLALCAIVQKSLFLLRADE